MVARLNLENEARQSKYGEDSNLILCGMNSEMEQVAIIEDGKSILFQPALRASCLGSQMLGIKKET